MKPYYQDDFVTIFHGDCRKVGAWVLEGVDLLVTDPPYGIGWKKGHNRAAGSRPHAGIANDQDTSVRDEVLATWGDRPSIVFGSFYAPQPDRLKQTLVWHKPPDAGVVGSTTGYRRDVEPIFLCGEWPQRDVKWPAVLRSTQQGISAIAAATGHPHTKPVDVMRTLIERTDARTVLDPFMGSGSTLVAAKELGRRAVGIELEERYCDIAARRCAQDVLNFEEAA